MRKPMQSWLKISLVAFFALSSYFVYRARFSYKEYIPTYFNGNEYFQSRDSITALHKKNIQKVFALNDVQCRVVDGKVFYKGSIAEDMLSNYTTKANDSIWLNQIRK